MKRYIGVLALLLAGCNSERATEPQGMVRLEQRIDALDRRAMIVELKSGRGKDVAQSHGVSPRFVYEHAIQGFAGLMTEAQIEALGRNPNVKRITEDGVATINEIWGLDRIDQRALPLSNSYNSDRTGSGVHAYIIDSGIRSTHTEFAGRIGNGADFTGSGSTDDCLGHGTHVSGTVGGTTYGVAKLVTLHPVRIFGCTGSTPNSVVIAATDWVAGNAIKPCVANMSFGGTIDEIEDAAVAGLIASGCTVAAAGGNSGIDACQFSPARVPTAITAGATDQYDTRAGFSNWGTCIDLFAPGVAVVSAAYNSDTGTLTYSGTSMSAPHVAGVAALYLERKPGALPAEVQDSLKAYSSKGVVIDAASPNWNLLYSGHTLDPNDPGPAPVPSAPLAPSNFVMELSTDGLTRLSWTDNSDNESLFDIAGSSIEGDSVWGSGGQNVTVMYARLGPGHWSGHVRSANPGGYSEWSNRYSLCIAGGSVSCTSPPPPPPDTTTPPPVCRPRGRSGRCK